LRWDCFSVLHRGGKTKMNMVDSGGAM